MTISVAMDLSDWWSLFFHFFMLSLLAVGGAISTAPDMHRYLVDSQRWLTDAQFSSSIALAQAAPGPNVLSIALMGWNVGLNAGGGLQAGWTGWAAAALGLSLAMLGTLIPSSTLTYFATRWAHKHRDLRAVRAFKAGMAPLVVALLMATAWLLTQATDPDGTRPMVWLLAAGTAWAVWKTQLHMLWLLGAGAAVGALGWV
jgi:chromate transporter